MTPEYIAGLFDGEGCVSLFQRTESRQGGRYTYKRWVLDVRIPLTNAEPLYRIHDLYGGGIHTENVAMPGHKLKTQWYLRDSGCLWFLLDIHPHCLIKRREIGLALEYIRYRYNGVVHDDLEAVTARIAADMKRDKTKNSRVLKRLNRPLP